LQGSGRFTVATRRGSATPHAGAAALRPDHYPLHCGAVVASRWRRGVAAPRPTRAQPRCAPIIPFIAGQWSLRSGDAARQRHAPRGRSRAAPLSLSPSLRGSGRFTVATRRGSATPHTGAAALRPYHYPLHCGAVVASPHRRSRRRPRRVGLNPLHCGAVVASRRGQVDVGRRRRVSIPFIAGQWSLPARAAQQGDEQAASQSPSLRGSGRFTVATRRGSATPHAGAAALRPYHYPLHCGAVVASCSVRGSATGERVSIPFIAGQWSLPARAAQQGDEQAASQSPSLRGSGRFGDPPTRRRRGGGMFQSPSLRGSGRFPAARRARAKEEVKFQSPSLRGSGRFPPEGGGDPFAMKRFNPLHCGAVVASLGTAPVVAGAVGTFQSPSLRGSGRFAQRLEHQLETLARFNPLHCGAVVASLGTAPVVAGAVGTFQSPSLRGSGRFAQRLEHQLETLARFNPLHCGAVVASRRRAKRLSADARVSIPFIAGQWSLHDAPSAIPGAAPGAVSIPFIAGQWSLQIVFATSTRASASLNPLHCGAVVASAAAGTPGGERRRVSIPFIAGQWSLQTRRPAS